MADKVALHHLLEELKGFKASQTLTKSSETWDEATDLDIKSEEKQDILRISSGPIKLNDHKLSVYILPYSLMCPDRLFKFRSDWTITSADWNCLMKKQILALRIILHSSSTSTSSNQSFQRSCDQSWLLCGASSQAPLMRESAATIPMLQAPLPRERICIIPPRVRSPKTF